MKKGSIVVGILLTMCISILLFTFFSSSTVRTHGLSQNRIVAGQAYYKAEGKIQELNVNEDLRQKIKRILAENMEMYTGCFQKTELPEKLDFSDDWIFRMYPDSSAVVNHSFLDITYHNRTEGVHCEVTGSFAFENASFCSETGVLDSNVFPEDYEDIQSFIGECTDEWVSFCHDLYPEKQVKDVRASSVVKIHQKPCTGYELRTYLGASGKHRSFVEEFESHESLNTIGRDSEFTEEETRTDLYLEKSINGFPRKDPTVLFGVYALDGDLYVNTDSRIYGVLIMKGGKIILGEDVKFSVHGLLISELPVVQTEECKFFYDYKYMLREAVVLPNFLDLHLIGIRE